MKIAFYSNFFTHHQLPFCEEMYKKYGENFTFVSTEKINNERINLGYKNMDNDYPYVLKAYENKNSHKDALKLAKEADVVIMGSTPTDEYSIERLKEDKITFRYYARIFYNGIFSILDFKNVKKVYERHFKYRKNKNLYMLAASSYSANDFNKIGMYKNKCFKWGYFPETKLYNEKELLEKKNNEFIKIVWVARFIKEKRPYQVIKLAKKLRKDNLKFKIQMIGTGKLFNKVKNKIEKEELEEYIELVGPVEASKVREYMENSNIFIFTSTKWERWGVVLNEALNSGCAVVANKEIGGVPFLIGDNKNGFAYKGFKDLYLKTKLLIENKKLREEYSLKAYNAIKNMWTAKIAVENFEKMLQSILEKKENPVNEGPASIAKPIKK